MSQSIHDDFYYYPATNAAIYDSPTLDGRHVDIAVLNNSYENLTHQRTPIYSDLNFNKSKSQLVTTELSKPRLCFSWCWTIFMFTCCTIVIILLCHCCYYLFDNN